jgi:hypothetical protein
MLRWYVDASQGFLVFAQRPEEPDGSGRSDRPAARRDRRANQAHRPPLGPSPQNGAEGGRPPGEADRLEEWRRRLPHLAGIGVLVAALMVLMWPGSPLILGLGTLLAALTLLIILVVLTMLLLFRGRRTP